MHRVHFSKHGRVIQFGGLIGVNGINSSSRFLPLRCSISTAFHFLKGIMSNACRTMLSCGGVVRGASNDSVQESIGGDGCSLSSSCALHASAGTCLHSATCFGALHPVPLAPRRRALCRSFFLHQSALTQGGGPIGGGLRF